MYRILILMAVNDLFGLIYIVKHRIGSSMETDLITSQTSYWFINGNRSNDELCYLLILIGMT